MLDLPMDNTLEAPCAYGGCYQVSNVEVEEREENDEKLVDLQDECKMKLSYVRQTSAIWAS